MAPKIDIIFNARTEGFSRGMDKVRADLNKTGSALENSPAFGRIKDLLLNPITAATAAATGFVRVMRSVVRDAERLRDIAIRISGTIKDAQGVQYAAAATGLDEGKLLGSIGKLRESTGEALSGSTEKLKAFQELGISVDRLSEAGPVELLGDIVRKFSQGNLSAREFAAANKLLGQSFEELLASAKRGLGERLGNPPGFAARPQDLRAAEEVGQSSRGIWTNVKTGAGALGAGILSGLLGLWRLSKAVTWGSGSLLGAEGAKEKMEEALLARELQFGPDQQTNLDRLDAQLMRQRQARAFLETLQDQNRQTAGGLAFEALPLDSQLKSLKGAQSAGMAAMDSLSPVERAQQMTALLQLQREILSVQHKIADELEKANHLE